MNKCLKSRLLEYEALDNNKWLTLTFKLQFSSLFKHYWLAAYPSLTIIIIIKSTYIEIGFI